MKNVGEVLFYLLLLGRRIVRVSFGVRKKKIPRKGKKSRLLSSEKKQRAFLKEPGRRARPDEGLLGESNTSGDVKGRKGSQPTHGKTSPAKKRYSTSEEKNTSGGKKGGGITGGGEWSSLCSAGRKVRPFARNKKTKPWGGVLTRCRRDDRKERRTFRRE